MTQITILGFMFQRSLQKQANKFNKGVVPQHKGIEIPVSTLRAICVNGNERFALFSNPTQTFCCHSRFSQCLGCHFLCVCVPTSRTKCESALVGSKKNKTKNKNK